MLLPLSPTLPSLTAISALPLPDALPICHVHAPLRPPRHRPPRRAARRRERARRMARAARRAGRAARREARAMRSEEHTSELQSLTNLVCRLLLEKKKRNESRTEDYISEY